MDGGRVDLAEGRAHLDVWGDSLEREDAYVLDIRGDVAGGSVSLVEGGDHLVEGGDHLVEGGDHLGEPGVFLLEGGDPLFEGRDHLDDKRHLPRTKTRLPQTETRLPRTKTRLPRMETHVPTRDLDKTSHSPRGLSPVTLAWDVASLDPCGTKAGRSRQRASARRVADRASSNRQR